MERSGLIWDEDRVLEVQNIIAAHTREIEQIHIDNSIDFASEFREIVDSKERDEIIDYIPKMTFHHSKNLIFKRL